MSDSYSIIGELNEECTHIEIKNGSYIKRVLHNLIGMDLDITLKPTNIKRSIQQNRWLWLAFKLVANFLYETEGVRYTKEQIYAFHLQHVWKIKIDKLEILGMVTDVPSGKTSSKWTKREFSERKDQLQEFWYNLTDGTLDIPDPVGNSTLSDYAKH